MYEVFACNYSDIYPTKIGYKGPRAGIYNLVIVIVNYVVSSVRWKTPVMDGHEKAPSQNVHSTNFLEDKDQNTTT